ncbi:hypothetical protein HIM_04395 [Hirsutella minnesotensis 3608]|uniref:Uncharacterized protein n=1 Tax=Hirsutella minnesotensis 3608 TaxID=1043627 RepID=A0A0F7ZVB3_9HYPO|nr:hypothetical protein HIM_04395 [Hirsutella minnesotensis 3608]
MPDSFPPSPDDRPPCSPGDMGGGDDGDSTGAEAQAKRKGWSPVLDWPTSAPNRLGSRERSTASSKSRMQRSEAVSIRWHIAHRGRWIGRDALAQTKGRTA